MERLKRRMPRWKSKGVEGLLHHGTDEQPLRAELYNVGQLERHAKALAASHQLATGRAPDKLIPRLEENERILIYAHDLVTAAVTRKRRIAPAAEWLLDN